MQEDYEYWILLLVNNTLETKIAFNVIVVYNKRLTWSFNFFSLRVIFYRVPFALPNDAIIIFHPITILLPYLLFLAIELLFNNRSPRLGN